jgi:hypothetical protein
VFWLGISLPSALALAALPNPLMGLAENAIAGLPTAVRAVLAATALPWVVGGAGVAAAAAELISTSPDDHYQGRRALDQFITWLARVGAFVVGLSMTVSIFIQYPAAPAPDQAHVLAPGRYVAEMLLAGLTMFRFGHPDFMTSTSFWSGFGWLDTLLPERMVTGLAVGTGVALLVTLLWIARASRGPAGAYFFLLMVGLVAAFAATAFGVIRAMPASAQEESASLHGRYLLGVYICLVSLCWHCLPRISGGMARRPREIVLTACGFLSVAIHTFALVTILNRYFG